MSNVVYLNAAAGQPDKFSDMVRELAHTILLPGNYNPAYIEFAASHAVKAAAPLRKWFERLPLDVSADCSAEQAQRILDSIAPSIREMRSDFLLRVVTESLLRASVVRQALDAGLEVVTRKDE